MSIIRRRAFTLIELLVVVAITGILLAILAPSLTAARNRVKLVKCVANLRTIAASSFVYAGSDSSAALVPVLPAALRDNAHLSASRRAFGGVGGLHDIGRPEDASPYAESAMYSACNEFGSDDRPLNRIISRDAFGDDGDPCADSAASRPEMDIYRCPSDVGYRSGQDGASGIFLYGGSHYGIPDFKGTGSVFEVTGNSYACDTMITGTYCPVPEDMNSTSHGVYLRPGEQIPAPARTTVYIEGNGFYAAQWNSWNPYEGGDPEAYTMGNHGTLREHTVAFGDGHVRPIRFEVPTRAVEAFEDGTLRYEGSAVLRGGAPLELAHGRYTPDAEDPHAPTYRQIAHFLFSGPDWTNHTYPARGIWVD